MNNAFMMALEHLIQNWGLHRGSVKTCCLWMGDNTASHSILYFKTTFLVMFRILVSALIFVGLIETSTVVRSKQPRKMTPLSIFTGFTSNES